MPEPLRPTVKPIHVRMTIPTAIPESICEAARRRAEKGQWVNIDPHELYVKEYLGMVQPNGTELGGVYITAMTAHIDVFLPGRPPENSYLSLQGEVGPTLSKSVRNWRCGNYTPVKTKLTLGGTLWLM